MATAKNIPPTLAKSIDPVLLSYLRDEVRAAINDTDSEKADRPVGVTSGNFATLNEDGDPQDSGKSNFNLADLAEKDYTSLDNAPVAETASDGPADAGAASAVSAISVSAGADTIALATFNTALGTLVTEINAIKSALNLLVTSHNTLKTAHNDIIDKLQAAGLME